MGIGMLCRGSMPQVLGMSLGLGIMTPACSSSESMPHDSGYHTSTTVGSSGSGGGMGGAGGLGGSGGRDTGVKPSLSIKRVSIGTYSGEVQSNEYSDAPTLNADGRYVAFRSWATNLVSAGDTNEFGDIFVHDRLNGNTRRINVSSSGAQANREIPDGLSGRPFISGGGKFIAFASDATNLVPNDTNNLTDIFVRDLAAETTERVSIGIGQASGDGVGSWYPSLSHDGRDVVFYSDAANLVPDGMSNINYIYARDRLDGITTRISGGYDPAISSNGQFVLFGLGDGGYIYHRTTSLTQSVYDGDPGGGQTSISATGAFVVYVVNENDNYNLFVWDRLANVRERVSVNDDGDPGDGNSGSAWSRTSSVSDDGRFVAFESDATNLVPGDTNGVADIFVRDRLNGITRRVSIGSKKVEGNGASEWPMISGDGRFVTFHSSASNFVSGDTNDHTDVFVVGMDYFFGP